LSPTIPELVDEFAKHIQAQTEAIARGDAAASNRHADKYITAWEALREEHGDAGRDGLAVLFQHPRADVRVSAAGMLLRHKTNEATRVLKKAAEDGDFAAELTLEQWRDGTWELDPAPTPSDSKKGFKLPSNRHAPKASSPRGKRRAPKR